MASNSLNHSVTSYKDTKMAYIHPVDHLIQLNWNASQISNRKEYEDMNKESSHQLTSILDDE